jgi:hypothetical protein
MAYWDGTFDPPTLSLSLRLARLDASTKTKGWSGIPMSVVENGRYKHSSFRFEIIKSFFFMAVFSAVNLLSIDSKYAHGLLSVCAFAFLVSGSMAVARLIKAKERFDAIKIAEKDELVVTVEPSRISPAGAQWLLDAWDDGRIAALPAEEDQWRLLMNGVENARSRRIVFKTKAERTKYLLVA